MKLHQALNRPLDTMLYRESQELVSNEDGIGVEIELENVRYFEPSTRYPDIYSLWKTVEDHSLRNGTEFIFKDALVGINITNALSIFKDFLEEYRYNGERVKVSDRCSVHVHLDVRDLDETQVNNLILVYMLVERVIFAHISQARSKNNYCRPLTDSNFKYTFIKLLESEKSMPNMVNLIRNECDKYSALNVLPMAKYGSVEFRHHPGTTNMGSILNWINIILSLKLAIKEKNITYYLNIYNSDGWMSLIKTIFPGTVLDDQSYLESLGNINDMVIAGSTDVTEILNYGKLRALSPGKSKVKMESSLFYQYQIANGLIKPPASPKPELSSFSTSITIG